MPVLRGKGMGLGMLRGEEEVICPKCGTEVIRACNCRILTEKHYICRNGCDAFYAEEPLIAVMRKALKEPA